MHAGTVVTLPGGALIGERLERAAAFRPLTGRLEEQLARLARAEWPRAQRVNAVLAAALAHVGGRSVDADDAARLSVPDRQFLMLSFALECGHDQQWRHVICTQCRATFDVGFRLSALPVTPAAAGYPWTELQCAGRRLRLRIPTGEDEAAIATVEPELAHRTLALRCVVSIDGVSPDASILESLTAEDIDAIDNALDAMSPQIATTLSTACTECGAAQTIELDSYQNQAFDTDSLYREVHVLASRYHWSEAQILRLPRGRRRLYLGLIDQNDGMNH